MSDRTFTRLPSDRLDGIAFALADAGLPAADLDEGRMAFFELADECGALGWAALEGAGADLLLRSVLTPPARRGTGAGTDLVRRVAESAAGSGAERLWLLTETAAPFFARLGFVEAERSSAPAAMRQTSEFRSLCPASATCMMLELPRP
jgi:amino-acid N-acetyltransferase